MVFNKKGTAIIVMCVVLIFALIGCTAQKTSEQGSTTDKETVYTLRLGHVLAADHPYEFGSKKFAELVAQYTNNKVQVKTYPAGQIGDERALWEGVSSGTIDMALSSGATLCNFDTSFLVFEMPFIFENYDHAQAVLNSDFGQQKLKNLEKLNIIGLDYWWAGWNNFASVKGEFAVPDDIKGKNVRTMESPMWVSFMKGLGANPVPMAFSEVYTSLQNGTLDGYCYPVLTVFTSKFNEVSNCYSNADAVYCPIPIGINKGVFEKLPAEYQEAIRKAALEAGKYERQLVLDTVQDARKQLEAKGFKFVDVDKALWRKAVQPTYDEMVPAKVPQSDIDAIAALAPSKTKK